MAFLVQPVEQEQYRVLLMLPKCKMALVENDGRSVRLPRISIPRWARIGEQLAEAVRTKWGVRSIVIDFLPKPPELPKCAVMEIRSHDCGPASDGLTPLQIETLPSLDLAASEYAALEEILMGATADRGPFSRLGWIDEVQEWIRASLPDQAIRFTEDVRHLNAGGAFVLLRLGTLDGPAYWVKATGAPNAHEFTVTVTLAKLFPHYLPLLVAARQDWNAWVMEEMGQALRSAFSLHSFQRACDCLAELQKASAPHVDTMLAGGCFDQRMPILRKHLPELIQYLDEAMAGQTSTKVPALETKRLRQLERLLEMACARMEALGIPDTLLHNDMNAGNILFNGERAVFTDWAEAYIGNPFLTFQHLRAQALMEDGTHTWATRLTATYKKHWCAFLSESQFEFALALSAPLAIVSYLCGRDPSFELSYRNDARHQGYARSLARHMDRAAQSPEFLEALCH